MAQHVLVPVDDSNRSMQALEFACREYPDATITALHVLDPGDFYAATGIEGGAMANYDEIQQHHETQAENLLEQAQTQAREYGVDIETDQVIGGISRSIVEYADEHDVDHVAVGSHGRTGASRILLGSVAEKVARRSPVPVTIVR
ncbi:Nucleotide-binding universal stress protein, UspA family [Natronorubrum sediminis]|uniref:Nucleotide-binding universal stress protein, UspA family n=1 Tax=Natronorubrum sediminis TaxID=640943 RepID=A0A1H6FZ65_9EURY|nr:universal stress protein [Natronorubrum sediminis]SEH16087.1 Nucleotide-binding universal stress protein, UspA family [Natronorubrum sediminis]